MKSANSDPKRPRNWYFSLVAPTYDLLLSLVPFQQEIELELPAKPAGLDLGGGTGRNLEKLPATDNWQPAVVLDFNLKMLKAGEKKRNYNFVAGAGQKLPFRDESFDLVLISDALHHMREFTKVFRASKKVLRAGGKLVIEEINPDTLGGKLIRAGELLLGMGSLFQSPAEMKRAGKELGFQLVSEKKVGFTQQLIFEKN